MRFISCLVLVAGMVWGANLHATESRLGVEIDLGISQVSGNGAKDSKSEMGLDLQQVDIFYHFTADKTVAQIQLQLLELTRPHDLSLGVLQMNALKDAWIQYDFHELFALKAGWESTFYTDYADWTEYSETGALSRSEQNMIEVTGSVAGFSYGLQMWEDQTVRETNTRTADDKFTDDQDTGLFNDLAVRLVYTTGGIEGGVIFVQDRGYKNAFDPRDRKDRNGYSVFAKFGNDDLEAGFVHSSQPALNEDNAATNTVVSVSYLALNPITLHLALDAVKTEQIKDGPDANSGTIMDLAAFYAFNDNYKSFLQYQAIPKDIVNNAEVISTVALGLQGRF